MATGTRRATARATSGAPKVTFRNMPLAEIVFDRAVYPRHDVDDSHVKRLRDSLAAGETLPPIVIDRTTKRIVDGAHRYSAYSQAGEDRIPCEIRSYRNDAELFKDAVLLNSASKLPLTTYDTLKIIEISDKLNIDEAQQAAILRMSLGRLRQVNERFATISEATNGITSRRVGLKNSVRHFAGRPITAAQETAIQGNTPGVPYLLIVRQLLSGLENDLLPDAESHPVLWSELDRLRNMLDRKLSVLV